MPAEKLNPQNSKQPLRVLIVEDSEPDAKLVLWELRRGGYEPIHKRVETRAQMEAALEEEWDVVISDHAMPSFSAPAALALLHEKSIDLPFIIVSGHIGEDIAVAAMKSGAHDYLLKDKLARLVPAVERELRELEVRRARRHAEEELLRSHAELEGRVKKRTSELTKANIKLQDAINERKRLEHELLEITEKERRRIGLDLHDDLGQKLAGVALMLKGLEVKIGQKNLPQLVEETKRIQSLIDEAIGHASGLARDLTMLDAAGENLPDALKSLAEQARNMFGIACKFKAEVSPPQLDSHVIRQFYKIAQEAVTNAIKHGKAKQVNINLSNGGSKLVMTIRNNGLPFPAVTARRSGMGLRIMNYRASVINASLDVDSDGQSGTIVTCTLPLN
jgi:signal transduction histidine kinase